MEVLCTVIVALHESSRQGDVNESSGEERTVGDDVDFELFCGVQEGKVVGIFLGEGLRH